MLKRSLIELEQKELLALIRDLYSASKENKAFLHARFDLDIDALEPYKATISRWTCPDVIRNQDYSVLKAICQLEENQQEDFVEHLEQVRFRESPSWDPMIASDMDSLMEQYRFDESG